MEINATLLVQMIVFVLFVCFTMKFVWPPLSEAMAQRQDKIADGLAAAEKGQRELELAQHRVVEELKGAKSQSAEIIEKANRRASQIIDEAKNQAKVEASRQTKIAQEQLSQEINNAKSALRLQFSSLAVAGAEKILEREIDEKSNSALLDKLIAEV